MSDPAASTSHPAAEAQPEQVPESPSAANEIQPGQDDLKEELSMEEESLAAAATGIDASAQWTAQETASGPQQPPAAPPPLPPIQLHEAAPDAAGAGRRGSGGTLQVPVAGDGSHSPRGGRFEAAAVMPAEEEPLASKKSLRSFKLDLAAIPDDAPGEEAADPEVEFEAGGAEKAAPPEAGVEGAAPAMAEAREARDEAAALLAAEAPPRPGTEEPAPLPQPLAQLEISIPLAPPPPPVEAPAPLAATEAASSLEGRGGETGAGAGEVVAGLQSAGSQGSPTGPGDPAKLSSASLLVEASLGQVAAALPQPPSPRPSSLSVPALTLTAPASPGPHGEMSPRRGSESLKGRRSVRVLHPFDGEAEADLGDAEGPAGGPAPRPRRSDPPPLAADVPQGEGKACAGTQTEAEAVEEGRGSLRNRRPKSAAPALTRARSARSFRDLNLRVVIAQGAGGPGSARGLGPDEGGGPPRGPSRAGGALLSAAEPDETSTPAQLLAQLAHVFNFYCAYGDPLNTGLLSSTNFVKFARDSFLVAPPGGLPPGLAACVPTPAPLTPVDAELLFKAVAMKQPAAGAPNRLPYDAFVAAVAMLAERVYPEEGASMRTPRRTKREDSLVQGMLLGQAPLNAGSPTAAPSSIPAGASGPVLAAAAERVLRRHVMPYASRAPPEPFLALMAAPELAEFVAAMQGTLTAVFNVYSKRRSGAGAGGESGRDQGQSLAVPRTPRAGRGGAGPGRGGAANALSDVESTLNDDDHASTVASLMGDFLQLAADFEVTPGLLSLADLAKIFRDALLADEAGPADAQAQVPQQMTRRDFIRGLGAVAFGTATRAHQRATAEALAAGDEPPPPPELNPETGVRVYSEFIFRMDRLMPAKLRGGANKKKISLVTPALEAFRAGRRPTLEKAEEIVVVDEAAIAAAERARLAKEAAEAAAAAEREAAEGRRGGWWS
eukprot:tig00000821_g4505.t1